MPQPTPFFAAFGALLFGRARRSAIDALLHDGQEGARSLSQFQSAFGDFIPKALLAPNASGTNSRQRFFCPRVTFWAFLAQVLERGSSCRDALRRIVGWFQFQFPKEPLPALQTSADCQARARLQDATLEKIGSHLADQMQRHTPQAALWRGRRVRMVDGTTVSMPDTAANQERWPQPKNQQPGCGFPLLKLVGLFCLQSGALLHCVHGSWRQSEAVLARLLWTLLEAGDLLLADRGFCSFGELHALSQRGVEAVMRLQQRRRADFRQGRPLGKDDRLVLWRKPTQRAKAWSQQDYDALPATLRVRRLRAPHRHARFSHPGSHPRDHAARGRS